MARYFYQYSKVLLSTILPTTYIARYFYQLIKGHKGLNRRVSYYKINFNYKYPFFFREVL